MKENKVVQLTWISKSELALLIKNNILDCIFFVILKLSSCEFVMKAL